MECYTRFKTSFFLHISTGTDTCILYNVAYFSWLYFCEGGMVCNMLKREKKILTNSFLLCVISVAPAKERIAVEELRAEG